MGRDARDIPRAGAEGLPDRLRDAGFDVRVTRETLRQFPDIVVTHVSCRRGEDVQTFLCEPAPGKPDECRITIFNAWSWWRSVQARRNRLQADVTTIIEQSGGCFPSRG